MAVQMLGIKTKFTDDQGRPLIGGSVHTYYAGTSLPQDTFSDPELTVPNTNPVKLDDTGSANIFLKGTYRVRVFDREGKFVEEQDNVDQLATASEVFKNKGGLNAANERIDVLTSEVNSVKEKTLVVESIADLSTIKNPKDGLRVYVKSYYAGVGKGGGYFTYDSSRSSINNGGLVINGWVREYDETVSVLFFGAVFDGQSHPVSGLYTHNSPLFQGYADLEAVKSIFPFITDGGDEIDFVAVQAAANELVKTGGEIHLPQGAGVFNRTVNLTGFFNNHITNLPVLHNKKLRFIGKGSANTRILGGEPGYGFFEMLGANYIEFVGLTLNANRKTDKCQYAICGGRPEGNASSGTFWFKDLHLYGFFSNSALYLMSSETNVWEDCKIYPQTGHGIVLSMNNIGWGMTPKYASYGTGLGGNGVNSMYRMSFLTANDANPDDILLAVEYGQIYRGDILYFASTHNKVHVQFRKSFGQTFISNAQHEQYGDTVPISYYFKGDDPLDSADYIDYRDFTLINSRLFKLKTDDDVRITNMVFKSNVFRNKDGDFGIDVARLYDSEISYSDRMPNVTGNSNLKVRVRQDNEGNVWHGIKLENIDVPLLAKDTVIQPTPSGKQGEFLGLDTRASIEPSFASAAITPVGSSDFSVAVDFVAPTDLNSSSRGIISLAGSATNTGNMRSLGCFFVNGSLYVEYLNTSINGITYKSVDPNMLNPFRGKRITIILTRVSGVVSAYINGVICKMEQATIKGSASFAEPINGSFLLVGARTNTVPAMARGVYRSAALFDKGLSVSEAYLVDRNGFASDSSCIGLWDFTKSDGTTLKAVKGTDGTIYGDGVLIS